MVFGFGPRGFQFSAGDMSARATNGSSTDAPTSLPSSIVRLGKPFRAITRQ